MRHSRGMSWSWRPVGLQRFLPFVIAAAACAAIIAIATTTGGTSHKPHAVPVTSTTAPVPATVPTTLAPTTSVAPQPVVALRVVFDGPTVTLQGSVPSVALQQRLRALAQEFATSPGATVNDTTTVNPAVALSAAVDVFDAQSVKFGSGSYTISHDHAVAFDRVVTALKVLPKTSVTVVGHADQTGDQALNYLLSQNRAIATMDYLVTHGIAPERVSAEAVGSADLATSDTDPNALALNRRVEFEFVGLLQ